MRSPQPKGPVHWTFGGGGYRHVWVHKNGSLFFGTAKESDNGDSGVQSIGSAVVEVTPGDYLELIARQTSASAKNVAADELTANVAVAQDPAGNLKPAKDKSTERIDGIVALIMAIGRAMVAQEEPQPSYQMFVL